MTETTGKRLAASLTDMPGQKDIRWARAGHPWPYMILSKYCRVYVLSLRKGFMLDTREFRHPRNM